MDDAERWERARRVFAAALIHDPAEWEAFLAEACEGDETLRREVAELLAGHRESDGFLDRPSLGPPATLAPPADPLVGRRIGSYRVLHPLGRGGMGAVYLGVRADDAFRKRVALKILPPGSEGKELVRRFRTERQILAALDHPNIAKLLDGGTTGDGLPYFVMEYIEGKPIDAFCDDARYGVDERLALFRTVCAAVQFAHQNLVLHRDLKPANILVGAAGTPKLLDFGIAKLLNPELGSTIEPTAVGKRLVTPRFASPEQLAGEPVATASDVFSLGVLLYHLLAGRSPHRIHRDDPVEIIRAVCEGEPEPPSTVFLEGGDELAAASKARGAEPGKLRRKLAGDLDAVVLKALAKNLKDRYASVEQLSEDVRRYLAHLPVAAAGGAPAYRLRKWLRRHALPVAAASILVAAILAAGVAVGNRREVVPESRIFEIPAPSRPGESADARFILDAAAERISARLDGDPELAAELLEVVAVLFRDLGDPERAEPLVEEALRLRRERLPADEARVARTLELRATLSRGE
jgi:serine/threonine protein kinase